MAAADTSVSPYLASRVKQEGDHLTTMSDSVSGTRSAIRKSIIII